MTTIVLDVEMKLLSCYKCGISFAMPEHFVRERRRDHTNFWCPNGHRQYFPAKSKEEKLRGQLAAVRDAADTYRMQRDIAQRSAASYKGHLTRTRKRIAEGTCPCCDRTFKQLSRHMEKMHPEYVEEHGAHDAEEEPTNAQENT